jgi:uncharacterized protein DUF1553/uncharacterized protein DUF1549/cytochrome c
MRYALSIAVFSLTGPARAAEVPDFNREVRPILAARCFKCHGPDDAARKAELRFDSRDGAEHVLRKPAESELVRRISSNDAEEVMPPASLKTPLTAREKETLKAWVAAGAKYDPHWSFVAPKRPAVPKTQSPVGNSIDAFIRARLEKEGLKSSPEADRPTLIRRVYLDLIGIPPTPEEVAAFVEDKSPQAFEKVVDRLLASPQYGERWARKWLDLARYADTNGYEKDRQRSIWPFRDWAIRAINDDMPFDQFTVEQLAGDMLPNATDSQRVATGFHRNTMLNEEGGIDPLEFRFHAMTDRVATTGTVWLGLTVGCAQCHTHKFDPISHTDYYRLFAFLNNADEPEFPVWTDELKQRRSQLLARIDALKLERIKKAATPEMRKAYTAWRVTQAKAAVPWTIVRPTAMEGGLTKLALQSDGSIFSSGDTTKRDVYLLTLENLPAGMTGIRLEALPDERLPANGPGRTYYEGPKGEFFLSEMALAVDGKPTKFASASDSGPKGGDAKNVIDGNPLTGMSTGGRFGQSKQAVVVLEKPLSEMSAKLELVFEKYYASSLGRFRISATTATENVKALDIPGDVEDALATPADKRTDSQWDILLEYWLDTAPEFKTERDEIEAIRTQLPRAPTTLVMQERPADHPRATHRHHRGEFLHSKEKVEPGVPSWLPPLPSGVTANRLAFAKWLVSSENPLAARVTVNRHWQGFFGRGIVRTLDDFGYQGEAPTHPELLDWLALELVEQKWSIKKLHKLIVTSATYRQASRVTPELLARDGENILLARGPRVRLEAEQIRDSALRAGGLLSGKMFGPSVFPPQPANITTEGAYGRLEWKVSDGEDRYRRGLYTFAKRTAPYAMGGTFDAPSGESCLARREVTNTALQALTMLNDVVLLDAARWLAKRVIQHDGNVEDRVAYLFRLCLAREPTVDEKSRIEKFHESQRARFAVDPERAEAVAGSGPGATADRAAWTATARAILNLDEFVTKE